MRPKRMDPLLYENRAVKRQIQCNDCHQWFEPLFNNDYYCGRCFAEEDGQFDHLIKKESNDGNYNDG